MPSVFRSLLLLSCLSAPMTAAAQDTPPVTDCPGLVQRLSPSVEIGPDSSIDPITDGCHVRDIYLAQSQYVRWRVADLRVTGEALFEAATAGRMPEQLDLTVTGAQLAPAGVPAAQSYVMEVVQTRYDLHLAYQWDAESHDFIVDDLTIKDARSGAMSLKGALSNLSELPAMGKKPPENAKQTAIRSLNLRLDNNGIFESLVVTPMISQMTGDEDPRTRVPQYQAAATSFVETLPDAVADGESKTALKTFIADFPHPAGPYEINIVAKTPITMAELAGAANPVALTGLLSRITISATHQPPEQE